MPPSLPPVAPETALVSSTDATPWWVLPPDSKVRKTAAKIVAMRIAGLDEEEIAKNLEMSPKSIRAYIYRAGKNGWVEFDDAKDHIEYSMMQRVTQNLEEGLQDDVRHVTSGMKVKTAVALKIAEGTIFKQFGEAAPVSQASTIVAIKIEMPSGPLQQMREDTTGGAPAYVDADIIK